MAFERERLSAPRVPSTLCRWKGLAEEDSPGVGGSAPGVQHCLPTAVGEWDEEGIEEERDQREQTLQYLRTLSSASSSFVGRRSHGGAKRSNAEAASERPFASGGAATSTARDHLPTGIRPGALHVAGASPREGLALLHGHVGYDDSPLRSVLGGDDAAAAVALAQRRGVASVRLVDAGAPSAAAGRAVRSMEHMEAIGGVPKRAAGGSFDLQRRGGVGMPSPIPDEQ